MADSKMTERQKRFSDYYLQSGNASEAARMAGYSERAAKEQGSRLLTKAHILKYIENRMKSAENTRIATATEVLETLTRILRREEQEAIVVTCKQRKSDFDKNGKKRIVEQEVPQIINIPTKISDVNRAAESLAKRFGLSTPDSSESGTVVQFIDDIPIKND